jgi:putative oxidoreductase
MDTGLLLLRLVFGLMMAAHGSQKLFGWFGGAGLGAVAGMFEALGFRAGRVFAPAAALSETIGGVLVAAGFLGPIGPALILAVMIVAAVSVHWPHGLFASSNGIELTLLYATGVAALALTGFGQYSLDAVTGLASLWTPAVAWGALVIGAVGGIVNLGLRASAQRVVVS